MNIRHPAVAGAFYPASSVALGDLVDRLLREVKPARSAACPKALVVPHAGYVYSGPIAASAYALLAPHAKRIERVVLVGPAHRARVDGLVDPAATHLRTPLGDLEVDTAALATALALPDAKVGSSAEAHEREHSLEVQLPFLKKVAPRAKIVPFAVGRAPLVEVARVLESLWGGPETVIVISSDLSHYLPYAVGRETDTGTANRIVALDPMPLRGEEACGAAGINGLLEVARRKSLRAELVDLRSSGDTAGTRDEVVGYGSFAFYEGEVDA